ACRVEISPAAAARTDYFLHVLTAADTSVSDVSAATARLDNGRVEVALGTAKIVFLTAEVGGEIELGGNRFKLADEIITDW
ncbi:MAG TPA: hypothetical protein VJ417_11065, partial [Candidatus Glassbacteria bacterium]|nr:hypothetical protein [Candidatus Glassbacteria bacterium]